MFEPTSDPLRLSSAILLYTRGNNHRLASSEVNAFASLHCVQLNDDGKAIIGTGRPMTDEDLKSWYRAMSPKARTKRRAVEILPDNILVHHPEIMAWWIPAGLRPAYFNLSPACAPLTKNLTEQTIVTVPYPAHVLVVTKAKLYVYALAASERPAAETPLLQSPILNVFADASLCWGNVKHPSKFTIETMADYEAALFNSWSTHPNPGQDDAIDHPQGLLGLWDMIVGEKATTFPANVLAQARTLPGQHRGAHALTLKTAIKAIKA